MSLWGGVCDKEGACSLGTPLFLAGHLTRKEWPSWLQRGSLLSQGAVTVPRAWREARGLRLPRPILPCPGRGAASPSLRPPRLLRPPRRAGSRGGRALASPRQGAPPASRPGHLLPPQGTHPSTHLLLHRYDPLGDAVRVPPGAGGARAGGGGGPAPAGGSRKPAPPGALSGVLQFQVARFLPHKLLCGCEEINNMQISFSCGGFSLELCGLSYLI